MSMQSPVGTLDIKNATLRVGKLEVSNIQGVDTALNVTRSNAILIYDDQVSTTTFTGFTSSTGVRDTSNGYLDLAGGYVYWGQKLPNSWVMEFEMDIRSGTSAGPLYSNIFSTSNVGSDGYTFTFNDNNDKITLKYNGTTLTEATVSGLFTASENWQKVAINYERGRIAISIGASRKFFYQDIERSTPYVNGEYINFSSASTDGRKIRNLKITNGTKWTYAGESNVAFQHGSVGIGVADPAYTLDVGGDINLSGSFYQGGSPFVSSLWTDGANSLYYRSNVEVGTGNLFVDTTTSNVGIRTTTPAYELDVSGNVHADYFTGDGSQLTGIATDLESVSNIGNTTSNTIQFTNATTGFVTSSNVGIANTNPQNDLDVGSNLSVLDTGSNVLSVTGNVNATSITIGDFQIVSSYGLDHITNENNQTTDTIISTNTTTGFNASSNIVAGGTVQANKIVSTSNLEVGTANLFVDTTTSNVGIGTNTPNYELDVVGNVNANYFIGDGSAISTIQSSNVSDFGSNVLRIAALETSRALETNLVNNSSRISTLSTDLTSNATRVTSLESGNMSISGDKTFTGDIIFESNIHMIGGNVFVANTVNLTVSDPIIELGSNNSGTNDLGIIMTRLGVSNSNVAVVFDESDDTLRMGYTLNGASDSVIELDSNALAVSVQGNVGIGTATTDASLHVFKSAATASEVGPGIKLERWNNYGCSIWSQYHGSVDCMNFRAVNNATDAYGGTPQMVLTHEGNLGIGTVSPQNKLDVRSDNYATFGKATYNAAGWSGIRLGTPYTTNHDAYCSVIESYNDHTSDYNSILRFKTSAGNNAAATERMRITSAGNVGIGTNNPSYTLDVDGTLRYGQDLYSTTSTQRLYTTGSSTNWVQIQTSGTSTNHILDIQANNGYGVVSTRSSTPLCLNPSTGGNVGIGTATVDAPLHIFKSGGNAGDVGGGIKMERWDNYGCAIWSEFPSGGTVDCMNFRCVNNATDAYGGTPQMVLTHEGRVGIATTSPESVLDVRHGTGGNEVSTQVRSGGLFIRRHHTGSGSTYPLIQTDFGMQRPRLMMMDTGNTTRVFISGDTGDHTYFNGGNFGIGTTSPVAKLTLNAYGSEQGTSCLIIGAGTGSQNLRIGCNSSSNYCWIQSHHGKPLRLNPAGNSVQYGTGNTTLSDDRIKDNEVYIENATDTLLKLKPQIYDKKLIWNISKLGETSNVNVIRESGLITQDVWYDAPELRHLVHLGEDAEPGEDKPVTDNDPTIDPKYTSWGDNVSLLEYTGLIPYLIKSNQEIYTELQTEKAKVADLLARVEALENA